MENRHPLRHPLVYLGITLLCVLAGYFLGSRTVFNDTGMSLASTGAVLGFCFGLYLSLLWWGLTALADV